MSESVGKGWGCLATVVIVTVPAPLLLFAMAWGGAHCDPVPDCQRAGERQTALAAVTLTIFAIIVGFGLAKAINALARRRDDSGQSIAFSLQALLLTGAIIAGALLLLFLVANFRS